MARPHREAPAGVLYHVTNRGSRKGYLFDSNDDYIAFERILSEGRALYPVRIVAYCLMRNHWHLLLWPEQDDVLQRFMHWLTGKHASHWRRDTKTVGEGAVYQSRYRASPIFDDRHLLRVWCYIERNPVRARLVDRAEAWEWSSAAHARDCCRELTLDPGPVERPRDWLRLVNGEIDWQTLEAETARQAVKAKP